MHDRHLVLAKVAYQAFTHGDSTATPWEALSEMEQKRWRRVAKTLRFQVEYEYDPRTEEVPNS